MSDFLSTLPDLEPPLSLKLKRLPPLRTAFRIPRLEEKPQNPILESIKGSRTRSLPRELVVLSDQISEARSAQENEEVEDIWTRALREGPVYKNYIASWDTLRSTYQHPSSPSPFITEQAPHIVSAARHQAYPRLFSPNEKLIYLSAQELVECLNSTLIGCSSLIHSWDTTNGRFVPVDRSEEGKEVKIIIDGMDEVVSNSYMERFLTIGTLLKRIDDQVLEIRRLGRASNPTVYGFGHSLSTALIYIRESASKSSATVLKRGLSRIVDFWQSFDETEHMTNALGRLCLRDVNLPPSEFGTLPLSPPQLLSHIYQHLSMHIEQQSPNIVVGLLSYIITVSSRPFFQTLGQSIGFEGLEYTIEAARNRARKARPQAMVDLYDDDEAEPAEDGDLDLEAADGNVEDFPTFMIEDLREAVTRARRSIKILSAPELDDTALEAMEKRKLEWMWTEEDLNVLTVGQEPTFDSSGADESVTPRAASPMRITKYKPELQRLALFDLEPGTGVSYAVKGRSPFGFQSPLSIFLSTFPPTFPSIAPTLPLLTDLVFSPVKKQAALLSKASLRLFMDPSSALHLRAHLVLLRGYLLMTSQAFRSRLSAALFSDQDIEALEGEDAQIALPIDGGKASAQKRHWAVGLSPKLIEQSRGQWPPYDSDLAFILRRVIMDSLESVRYSELVNIGVEDVWNEAESRIGFATRPLPNGRGGEKGADPMNIEALDFLYTIYKPPRPLTCLITGDILLKYRRVFSFLLRLLRVENVMHILFRLTRISSATIFPYNSRAQNILVHFRFAAQAFMASLSSYVYDTAIGGNFDAFLAHITSAESSPDLASEDYFSDVFSLMQRHSRVMDDILSACLLRTVQKAVREVLESVLGSIVEFGVLIGNVRSGHIKAAEAAVRVEELLGLFKEKSSLLTKALHKMVDKSSTTPGIDTTNSSNRVRERSVQIAPGGMEALVMLLDQLTGVRSKI